MPTDGDANTTRDSQSLVQGWLAKCTPKSLSVRGRRASDGDSNRPVMILADQTYKKRKRISRTPLPSSRTPIKTAIPDTTMASKNEQERKDQEDFDKFLRLEANEEFQKKKTKLIEAETNNAWDHKARKEASENERRAEVIIRQMRDFERREVFRNVASEELPPDDSQDMGGQFLTNKARIEQKSKLYQLAKEVPKGAILHLHFNAELNPERLLEEARSMNNMFVWSNQCLRTDKDLAATEMMFKIMPDNTKSNNIFSEKYIAGGKTFNDSEKDQQVWMRWTEFRKVFSEKFPNLRSREAVDTAKTCSEQGSSALDPAENWILQKMVLDADEAYDPQQTVNGVWARFNQATRCFKGLLNYQKVYEWYIGSAIQKLIDEKVMYAELRPMLLDKFIPTNDGTGKIDHEGQMELIKKCVENKKAELVARGQGDLFPFGLKIIYCTPRSIKLHTMRNEMLDCIKLKEKFGDLICGFDLVGAEDRPNHIGFYFNELVAFRKLCQQKDLEIPFLFHAGETLLDTGGSQDPLNSNLIDAVALQSKRIGHGYSLLKHPHLIEKFRKTPENPGICIELCPISNELLHLCRNIKEHPYPELLAAGIPCTVNSDNPSLFSNSMSHEFYQIMVGSPAMNVHSWKQLALWSLEYSCLEDLDKAKGIKIFMEAWEKFCVLVVAKFDHLFVYENDKYVLVDAKAKVEYGIK